MTQGPDVCDPLWTRAGLSLKSGRGLPAEASADRSDPRSRHRSCKMRKEAKRLHAAARRVVFNTSVTTEVLRMRHVTR